MKEIIIDTIIDALKLLPFLFITFVLLEYMEHKTSNHTKKIVEKSGKLGPIIGSFLGIFPQCGFSVAATNLYATKMVTLGTLIAVYLSTSDEMLPILISEQISIGLIIQILIIKVLAGIIIGILIDTIIKPKDNETEIEEFCHNEHCHCEHGILKSSMKHTLHILCFIVITTFFLNVGFSYLGENTIKKLFLNNNPFSSFLTGLIGLIPNCGASVVVTELYLNHTITFGAMMAGLLTGSGIALLVLFKTNKNLKENLKILTILYSSGVVIGMFLDFLGIFL